MTVTLPYDPVWRPLEWAKKHCPSYITNDVHCNDVHCTGYMRYDRSKIDYFFSDDKDAIWFLLRWSS